MVMRIIIRVNGAMTASWRFTRGSMKPESPAEQRKVSADLRRVPGISEPLADAG